MSRMRTLCTALLAVFALVAAAGATQAAAEFTLPDVHTLSDVGYPVIAEGTLENGGTIVAELETEIGEKMIATAVNVKVSLEKLSALGPATLTFKGISEPKSKTLCLTSNTKVEGEAIVSGEYHIVTDTALTQMAVLVLFPEVTLECNSKKLKIKVKAPLLIKLEKVISGSDVESYGLVANCTAKGKQELKEYVNDSGASTKGVLLANFGLGSERACLRTTKELVVKSSAMIDFLF